MPMVLLLQRQCVSEGARVPELVQFSCEVPDMQHSHATCMAYKVRAMHLCHCNFHSHLHTSLLLVRADSISRQMAAA